MTFKFQNLDCSSKLFSFSFRFMEERNTPIERPPMLGFKQSKNLSFRKFYKVYISLFIAVDLHVFF